MGAFYSTFMAFICLDVTVYVSFDLLEALGRVQSLSRWQILCLVGCGSGHHTSHPAEALIK
jgi:hypothetical protein